MLGQRKVGTYCAGVLSLVGVGVLCSTTDAALIPFLQYRVQTSTGGDTGLVTPVGIDQGAFASYDVPFAAVGGLAYWGDINGRDSTHPNSGMLATTMNFRNDNAATVEVIMDIWMDDNTGGLPIEWEDSCGLTLVADPGVGGGLFSSVGPDSMWNVLIDGNAVDGIFDHPSFVAAAPSGSGDLSTTVTNGPFGSINNEVQVRMHFTLTPGEVAGFNGSFLYAVVPAPGAFALMGLAGLVGTRRRRA